jgi:hypothetical protein
LQLVAPVTDRLQRGVWDVPQFSQTWPWLGVVVLTPETEAVLVSSVPAERGSTAPTVDGDLEKSCTCNSVGWTASTPWPAAGLGVAVGGTPRGPAGPPKPMCFSVTVLEAGSGDIYRDSCDGALTSPKPACPPTGVLGGISSDDRSGFSVGWGLGLVEATPSTLSFSSRSLIFSRLRYPRSWRYIAQRTKR